MKNGTVLPSIICHGGDGTPLDAHMVLRSTSFEEGVTNDDLYRVWVNSAEASKCDVGSRVEDRGKDKVCGQKK